MFTRAQRCLLAALSLLALAAAELVQVQVVMRAGARKWVSYNKPRREFGSGLLPAGYAQMEQNGKILKARYFGPTADVPLANVTAVYKNGDAIIRAVARDQTASSADAMAYGIWSPVAAAAGQTKAVPLTGGYQAVPTFTISRGMDYLLSASTSCSSIDERTEAFFNSAAFKQKAADTAQVREYLGAALGMPSELQDTPHMYDRVLLNTQYGDDPSGGETLPAVTAEQFTQLQDMAFFVEKGKFGNPQVGFLCGGPLLSEVFDRMGAMESDVKYRATPFLAYVGSHATVNCLLSALNTTDPTMTDRIHAYGSMVVFELHNVANEYFLEVLFLEGGTAAFKNLYVGHEAAGPCGEGGSNCPITEARRILSDRMQPNLMDWCDACENSYIMPACLQSLQVKMSESMGGSGGGGGGSRQKQQAHGEKSRTVGAAFIGLIVGAVLALLSTAIGPMVRRRWGQRGYSEHNLDGDVGIEAPNTGRGGAGGGAARQSSDVI